MSQGPTIHSSRVLRQMDHLIMALKVDVAAERPDVLLSLYWIGYTVEMGDAASGHVAYLWWTAPTGPREREAALTDNPGLAEALGSRLRPAQWPMRDPGQAALPATFERQVARPYGIAYRVRADGLQVDARWDDLGCEHRRFAHLIDLRAIFRRALNHLAEEIDEHRLPIRADQIEHQGGAIAVAGLGKANELEFGHRRSSGLAPMWSFRITGTEQRYSNTFSTRDLCPPPLRSI